jgi:hypothetical protein
MTRASRVLQQAALVLLATLACAFSAALVVVPNLWPSGVAAELLPSQWVLAPLALLAVGAFWRLLLGSYPLAGLVGAILASLVTLAWCVVVDRAMANPYEPSPSLAAHVREAVLDLRFWGYSAAIVLIVVSLPVVGYALVRAAQ